MTKRDIIALASLARAELTDSDTVEVEQTATQIVVRATEPERTWYVSDGKVRGAKGNPPPPARARAASSAAKTRSGGGRRR